jgi:hypothetical protein
VKDQTFISRLSAISVVFHKISKREKMMSDSMSVLPENKLLSKFISWPKTVLTQSESDKVLLAYYFDLPDVIVKLMF